MNNYTYTGALVSRKSKVVEVGNPKTVPCEPIIVEGTHEGIITLEEFEQIKAMVSHPKLCGIERTKREYPLRSILYCGHCKKALTRTPRRDNSYTFTCHTTKLRSDTTCPEKIYYPETGLEEIVLAKLKEHYSQIEENSFHSQEEQRPQSDLTLEIKQLKAKIKDLKYKKRRDYEKYTENKQTKEEFFELKEKTDAIITELEETIETKEQQLAELLKDYRGNQENATSDGEDVKSNEKLTQELARRYVKAVYVYDMENIEVEFHNLDKETL